MNVAIGSAFRNSAGYPLQRYFSQVSALHERLDRAGHQLRVIAVEGDSADDTRFQLMRWAQGLGIAVNIETRNHGKRVFGSTEEPERMAALSFVGNGILESVREEDDVLVYVESDLVWRPEVITHLIEHLAAGYTDVVSPLIFAGDAFYDIWAFRKGGFGNEHRFGPFRPYHPELKFDQLTQVDSTGSCLVMRGEVARRCRIINDEALVGFCKDVQNKGFILRVDARLKVNHP
jgi:hypothetical protein